jgi:hypothetical protein
VLSRQQVKPEAGQARAPLGSVLKQLCAQIIALGDEIKRGDPRRNDCRR